MFRRIFRSQELQGQDWVRMLGVASPLTSEVQTTARYMDQHGKASLWVPRGELKEHGRQGSHNTLRGVRHMWVSLPTKFG